jgi:hypothetical protein
MWLGKAGLHVSHNCPFCAVQNYRLIARHIKSCTTAGPHLARMRNTTLSAIAPLSERSGYVTGVGAKKMPRQHDRGIEFFEARRLFE